ncbi:methylaspartate mutase sigma subunit [Nocardiopsis mwathae]|uniref:Methylaspartate mutase sigma subunit n=1 Tax=Nocardiopsis mwathae TaxID=1472723 RepID=A0A7W9YDR2_9ACTN|nr:cobalamin-dependent protein [Nocardiopsis mwathae]MBB6170290.1 methylaspartate mutase sigma subunit [Nocardiopsis mwathae]
MSESGSESELEPPQNEASKGTVVVTTMASDSHTWNLVFLQLLIEELGYDVVNLGPCVPDDLLVRECRDIAPEMVVISSVNGHGYQDGMRVISRLRAVDDLAATPMVIGGKLGIAGGEDAAHIEELMAAGFDGVFQDGVSGVADFRKFIETAPAKGRELAAASERRRLSAANASG